MTELEKELKELDNLLKTRTIDKNYYDQTKAEIIDRYNNPAPTIIETPADESPPPPKKLEVKKPDVKKQEVEKPEVKKPVIEQEEAPAPPVEEEFKRGFGAGKKVLIVDDSAFIAKQISQILTSENFEITAVAADGAQGVAKYKELHPKIDLVVLDLIMPVMDGITALEKIFGFDKNANVVVISSEDHFDKVKKCLLMGAKSYFMKPFDRVVVLNRINSVLK